MIWQQYHAQLCFHHKHFIVSFFRKSVFKNKTIKTQNGEITERALITRECGWSKLSLLISDDLRCLLADKSLSNVITKLSHVLSFSDRNSAVLCSRIVYRLGMSNLLHQLFIKFQSIHTTLSMLIAARRLTPTCYFYFVFLFAFFIRFRLLSREKRKKTFSSRQLLL